MSLLTRDVFLDSHLAPLADYLARRDITDIFINRPGEVWIETIGGAISAVAVPELSARVLARLARQIAAANAQGISRRHPLLAAALPDGSRVQIVMPPATRGEIAMAIRKHLATDMSLDALREAGAFAATRTVAEVAPASPSCAADAGDMVALLRAAVRERRNILISGGTSTGKTTFLNALLAEIPAEERLILIEDTPELRLTHPNAIGLLAARGGMGEAEVTAEDLLIASLRMRPDRIVLGEMRGNEAMTFLRAVNTGHPGSLTTIHADSPQRALDQLALLVLRGDTHMSWNEVMRHVRASLDLVVQLGRRGGVRSVESVMHVSG